MWIRAFEKLIKVGTLKLQLPDGSLVVLGHGRPQAEMVLHDTRTLRRIVLDPALQVGETYIDGGWDAGRGGLLSVLEFMFRNLVQLESRRGLMTRIRRGRRWLAEWNTVWRSRRNVSHHYDLNENLYRRFLDADMQYSCAYFERPDMSLEAAQQAKCRHIARKLLLNVGDKVLDIGSGWGGLALYLAREHRVEVTGLTLSTEQLRVARSRVEKAGLERRVRFELQDYRQHHGDYDAIVSVGMFEHVGRPHYSEYMQTIQTLLRPGGRVVLHSIGRTGQPNASNPWMRKYIFPGGYIPALSEIMPAVEGSGLMLADVEVLHSHHYADTLAAWHQRFQAARHEIAEQLGERFCRIWEFYLQASEASFRWYDMVVFQLQMTRESTLVPRTRDYLYKSQRAKPAKLVARPDDSPTRGKLSRRQRGRPVAATRK